MEKLNHYLAKFSIFLITVALIVGMIGCGEVTPPTRYNLTMAVAPAGSGTATDLTNASPYTAGTVVSIKAVATPGYGFRNWTAPAGTFGNATATQTTFTMPAQNVTVTANFALGIWDWYDLDAIRNNLSSSYLLMNDLDSTTAGYAELASPSADGGHGWEPIGGTYLEPFSGLLDGQGYEIRELFINRPDQDWVGLFGYVDEGGAIKNIGMVSATVIGHHAVGGLVGHSEADVSNSYSIGNITGQSVVGALVGRNWYGTVSNSYSAGNITGQCNVGGLVGRSEGDVNNSYSTCSVTGDQCVGGLVGFAYYNTVGNSYSTGNIIGQSSIGGLVGFKQGGTLTNSYSTGSVTGDQYVGGLVGYGYSTVSNSFWDTQTNGQSTSDGGIGKTTAEMQDIDTFSDAAWDIVAVANPGTHNPSYIWNIVDDQTYPFLNWQP